MTRQRSNPKRRIVILTVVLLTVAMTVAAVPAAAHTPSCIQTAGDDGPHYDDDPRTGSQKAYEKNPTLGGDFKDNAPDSCSVGNSQSPRSDN